jgi:two-component system chemotaxis sensor kinase CheA
VSDRIGALQARLLATFRVEAEEHLRAVRAELDAATADGAPENTPQRLENLFRSLHTLKGAARSVGLVEFEHACHRCETLLHALIRNGAALSGDDLHVLVEISDALEGFVAGSVPSSELARFGAESGSVEPTAPVASGTAVRTAESTTATIAPAAADVGRDTIRVEIARLDRLVALTENLLSPKLAAAENVRRAREIAEQLATIRSRVAVADELRSLEVRARALVTAMSAESKVLRTAVDDLYEEMRRVRMMPASSILEGIPLMVRDLSRETGKEVAWETIGAHLEIDRKVLDLVKDPLIHLVRNAIDHGIEAPEVRVAAGKPRRGRVSVTIAPTDGGRISVEIADDGRGFAIEAIRDAAVRSRLASAERIAELSDADVAELAYSSGISTSPVITTISGHGRGLAIVRERIERVDGRVSTHSTAGVGTVIRLEFPASIATYHALLVGAGGARFLLPVESVERVFAIPREGAVEALARGLLSDAGKALPFGSLATILGLPRASPTEEEHRQLPCVLVHSGERRGILLVDEVIGEHEVVIKDLRPPLRRVRNVLATGLLGTGQLVLLLRPLDILLSIHARPAGSESPEQAIESPRVLKILVVDDSITTRTMERNLFEAAGYAVRVAPDGIEAWNMLQSADIDMVVSDIDMPRMDGFELTSRIRAHPKLADLPVVLVTALEAREDKERGIRVGANAYVVKSGFNQANLLEIVRRLT